MKLKASELLDLVYEWHRLNKKENFDDVQYWLTMLGFDDCYEDYYIFSKHYIAILTKRYSQDLYIKYADGRYPFNDNSLYSKMLEEEVT